MPGIAQQSRQIRPGEDQPADAIGGYLELEWTADRVRPHPQAVPLQSARAALHALVQTGRPAQVWMPRYICDAMLAPLHALSVPVAFYDLDDRLGVQEDVKLGERDWLLYVNYFGISGAQASALLQRFPPEQLIFDHSQAFFHPALPALATIYSPRKFFGLPDGGLLVSTLPIDAPGTRDNGSILRSEHLLQRLADTAESGYAAFQSAEETLWDTRPSRMSQLTARLLSSVDAERARVRRNANFHFLHDRLGPHNGLFIDTQAVDGPLCYPFQTTSEQVRKQLLAERVFTATYWPEVRERSTPDSVERRMTDLCIPLPCDQRYDTVAMTRIADSVLRTLDAER